MKKELVKSGIIATISSILYGGFFVGISMYLDWKNKMKNPEAFEKLAEIGMPSILNWKMILISSAGILFFSFFLALSILLQKKKKETNF